MSWQSQTLDVSFSKFLRAKLESILVYNPDDARFIVRVSEVSSMVANASISIRKGGAVKVPMYDISFTVKWEGTSVLGATRPSLGILSVSDILPEEVYKSSTSLGPNQDVEHDLKWLEFPISVVQDVTTRGLLEVDEASLFIAKSFLVQSVRDAVRSVSKCLLRIANGEITADILENEALLIRQAYIGDKATNDEKIKNLAKVALSKRTAALEIETKKSIAKASADRVKEKEKEESKRVLEEEEETEKKKKKNKESILSLTTTMIGESSVQSSILSPPSPLDAVAEAAAYEEATNRDTIEHIVSLQGKAEPAGAAPEVIASSWNVNKWGWEEKEFTPWARKRLNELLAGVDVDVPSGHIRIVEVETVRGDATVSMRKGKSFVTFELEIEAHWEGTLMDDDGKKLGSGDGDLVVSNLDHETGPLGKFIIGARPSSDGGKIDKRLAELTAKWGALIVKKRVTQFVKELLEKGDT